MNDLQLQFREDRIVGAGVDVVGEFAFDGTVSNGDVILKKQYVDAHEVIYTGTFDGEGTLQGLWSISGVGGRWLIRIVQNQTHTDIVDLF